jgi:hypothetical protein
MVVVTMNPVEAPDALWVQQSLPVVFMLEVSLTFPEEALESLVQTNSSAV